MKTVSLELSKQLKEAGYPQVAGEFSWWWNYNDPRLLRLIPISDESCTSPTADEILDQLRDVEHNGNEYFLTIGHSLDARWQLDYRDSNEGQLNAWVGDNLADLAAQAWIFLKSEKVL